MPIKDTRTDLQSPASRPQFGYALPENIYTLLKTTSDCYTGIKNWTKQNKLQLNSKKQQCSSEQDKNCPPFPSTPFSLTIPQSLSLTVKSHGLLLYSTLSMENFISQTAKSLYYHLRRISSVLKYLSTEATVKLVTSLVLSTPRLLQFSPFWPACFLCP